MIDGIQWGWDQLKVENESEISNKRSVISKNSHFTMKILCLMCHNNEANQLRKSTKKKKKNTCDWKKIEVTFKWAMKYNSYETIVILQCDTKPNTSYYLR